MAGLLLDTPLDDEQRVYAETVVSSGESLLHVLNDILDYSKIEAGKLDLEEAEFAIVSVVDSAIELFAHQAHSKGLDMPVCIDPGIPALLYGDEGRIRQILLNLISNAIKFTERGGVTVEVSVTLRRCAEDRCELRFDVTDSGIGIPADRRAFIFEQFTQVDGSATRRHGGTGLGLAICKRLVDMMGGEIGVEGRESGGSRFWFTVPFGRGGSNAHWSSDIARRVEGLAILVVDDNALNRLVCERQLTALGATVTVASGAASAVAKATSAAQDGTPFDVAIVDHLMPETDGIDLCALLRAETDLAGMRIILSSSSGMFNSHQAARKHGFDAALPKPLRPGALIQCFEALADASPAQVLAAPGPKLRPGNAAFAAIADPSHAGSEPVPAIAAARILLAEDNATNQKLFVSLLKRRNYVVDVAANGLEALDALHNRPYDLILMDVQMPEMDGFETTARVRSSGASYADLPIIGITAHAMKGDRERVIAAGMDDYLSKPINKDQLFEKVAHWTRARTSAAGDAYGLQQRLAASF